MKKYFIFGHCRNMLRRLLPHWIKDIMFLDCTSCTVTDENRKPCEAPYNSRQSGNLYDTFTKSAITNTLISSVSWASPLKIVRSPLRVMVNSLYWLGIDKYAYREFLGLFLPLERSNGMNDRQLGYKKQIGLSASFWGLGVDRLVFSLASKISFPLTGLLNLK